MTDWLKLLFDTLLVTGFGMQHSVLATLKVKAIANKLVKIDSLAWRSIESLTNISYIFIAAWLWQPVDQIIWSLEGVSYYVAAALVAASWVWYWQLHLFEYDCGLAFGSTSFVSAMAGKSSLKNPLWKIGSRRWIRFPVHTAFFPMFFLIPTMTADLLTLAIVLNIYNVIGTILYDKRLEKLAGVQYSNYQKVTGNILPNFKRLEGAKDIETAAPQHWKTPHIHVRGVVGGIILGVFYWVIIGVPNSSGGSLATAAAAGLVGSMLVGFIIGAGPLPGGLKPWQQMQTNLSTTVALASALGIIVWAALVIFKTHDLPYAAAFLPMWFTVQYMGHVIAYLVGNKRWFKHHAQDELEGTPPTMPQSN
ncbi:hypothetical protein [uncultured Pseudomonas sp.]|uniref:hypothetical protein n=1 Tax=uncultured Pseudomonas sp. TaxID=114707 RepID=UPI0025FB65C6|nr:hypothetical protein [uncultured Pseudomonas sp.]